MIHCVQAKGGLEPACTDDDSGNETLVDGHTSLLIAGEARERDGTTVKDECVSGDGNEGKIKEAYCDASGNTSAEAKPNGSLENIAGICNEGRNVFGMMPHPERAADPELGNTDGVVLFESILRESVTV